GHGILKRRDTVDRRSGEGQRYGWNAQAQSLGQLLRKRSPVLAGHERMPPLCRGIYRIMVVQYDRTRHHGAGTSAPSRRYAVLLSGSFYTKPGSASSFLVATIWHPCPFAQPPPPLHFMICSAFDLTGSKIRTEHGYPQGWPTVVAGTDRLTAAKRHAATSQ